MGSGGGGGQDSVRPLNEDVIWRSEVRLKGAAGAKDTQCFVTDIQGRHFSGAEIFFSIPCAVIFNGLT